jgi:hypothetical protein
MIKEYIKYLKDNPQGYWFKAKPYGWGWIPVRWQGWVVLLAYIMAILFFALAIDERSTDREVMFIFVLPAILLTITLIRVCYRTGEKPRWQWGLPSKEKKDQ